MKHVVFSILLILTFRSTAQLIDLNVHLAKANKIAELYNTRNFVSIYSGTSNEFKKANPELEFTQYLDGILYKQYGEFISCTHLKDEKSYQAFLVQTKKQPLQMNLALNTDGEVTSLRFVPFHLPPGTRLFDVATDNPMKSKLDSVIDKTLGDFIHSSQNCGISIGITTSAKQYYYNYGETKRASKKLPDNKSIYEIGSLTNTFTGLLLAQAVIEKKLTLDDDIRKYLLGVYPDLQFNGQAITIVQLANHSSGLPGIPLDLMGQPGYDSLIPYKHYSKKMLLDYLHKVKLNQVPGSTYKYSSYGIALLGLILEAVYNTNYEELLKEKIVRPYNLLSTTIHLNEEQKEHAVSGYDFNGRPVPDWELGGFAPTGGMRSGCSDLMTFLGKNMDEKDPALSLSQQITYDNADKTALTWFVDPKKFGDDLYWQNGGTFGCSAFYGFMRKKKLAIVILANSSANVDHLAISILKFLSNFQ